MSLTTLVPGVLKDAEPNLLEIPSPEAKSMEQPNSVPIALDASSAPIEPTPMDTVPSTDLTQTETLSLKAEILEHENASATDQSNGHANYAGPSRWHALLATWLGGVFDGMDSSIFAIVLFPALSDLLHTNSHAIVGLHGSYIIAMFMVGWALGAMIFGMAADHLGRARVLTFTIILYAVCTGLCATASTWWELGLYRFLVGAGIGGEMGIGAVLLSECWPGKSRVHAVSAMATSLGFGYFLTAGLNLWLGDYGWRWLFVAGIAPAFLTVYIRMKLKEPKQFIATQKARAVRKESGAASEHTLLSTIKELFNETNKKKTLAIVAVSGTAIITWWAVVAWIPAWVNQLTGDLAVAERSHAMFLKDIGMILSGVLGGWVISKLGYKRCMAMSFLVSFICATGMFLTTKTFGTPLLFWILALGFFAHLPFVILWMYIPELYEARIRSTAFGFTYNIGRLAAAVAALGSGALINIFGGSYAIAASTVATIYLAGAVATIWMPKTNGQVD
ncbi:MAG: MFS transporter [Candidatus Melainabacteria bacterium]|nr:MFS transporter [Candidatus Melainabacteria bacterium]